MGKIYPQLGVTYSPKYPAKANGSTEPTRQTPPISRTNSKTRTTTSTSTSTNFSKRPGTAQCHPLDYDRSDAEVLERLDLEIQKRIEAYWEYKYQNNNNAPQPKSTHQQVNRHSDKVRDPLQSYLLAHSQWEPQMQVDDLLKESNNPIVSDEKAGIPTVEEDPTLGTKDQFISHIHVTGTISEDPLPPLTYHASCTSNEKIYIIGGARTIYTNHTPQKLDLDKFKVNPVYFPTPVNSQILNNPCVIPNYECWTLSSQTHVFKKFKPSGDVPPPLMCMTASLLTERYCFYYGGFELLSEVSKNTQGQFVIDYSIRLNHTAYILDLQTFQFKKHELIAHPSYRVRTPVMAPRFGHTSNAVVIRRESDGLENPVATVYVMGGFCRSDKSHKEYEVIKDLWKLEAEVTFRGTHGYLEFAKEIIATPLSIASDNAPAARAFHVGQILDDEYSFGKHRNELFMTEAQKARYKEQGPVPSSQYQSASPSPSPSPPTPTPLPAAAAASATRSHPFQTTPTPLPIPAIASPAYRPFSSTPTNNLKRKSPSSPISNLKLIIHGGTDTINVFGDVWWFDLESETWHCLETFFNKYDSNYILHDTEFQPSIVKKCGHVAFVFDCYLVLLEGAIPSDFTLHRRRAKAKDISELFIKLKDMDRKDMTTQYHRFFMLNLKTAKWFVYKTFHKYQAMIPGAQSQLSYINILGGSADISNSRVYYIGGVFMSNYKYIENERKEVLNNAVEIVDFPLSTFSAQNFLQTRTYTRK